MRSTILILLILLLFIPPTRAYWPTTVEENLSIAADSTFGELYPTAIPSTDGKIIVTYLVGDVGTCYQVVDRFGELQYPPNELLCPGLPLELRHEEPRSISDGAGGVFVCWKSWYSASVPGIYAQRLDSAGNLLWGDEGVRILSISDHQFDICADGQGGFWLATAPGSPCGTPTWGWLWVQRVDAAGNLALGDSGLVAVYSSLGLEYPLLAPDGEGGCFIVWEDNRLGMAVNAIYTQHLDGSGNTLWPQDLYICQQTFTDSRRIIPDGEGGFILQAAPGGADYNTHWRIDGDGNILWTRDHLSWWFWAEMVSGEPGFFYLCFTYSGDVYGQRMDMEGNNYWPQNGALMSPLPPGMSRCTELATYYCYSYFYCGNSCNHTGSLRNFLYVQSLDSLGNRQWGEIGALLASHPDDRFRYTGIVPDDEAGIVSVWQSYWGYDIYAKRCNDDGTLGGPSPLSVDLAPHNPPVQIPSSGGSFFYDIAIADSDSVGGFFDAWIEVTLPNGSTLEILSRNDISVGPGNTVSRMDLEQYVPPNAPAGIYTYTAYAGNYPYQSPWGQDNFTFEKLAGRGSDMANDLGWALHGFFGDEGRAASAPSDLQHPLLSVHPNPFNLTTTIHFTLPLASWVDLEVFDINGRSLSGSGTIPTTGYGWYGAGTHEVNFDGSDLASGIYFVRLKTKGDYVVKKVLLMK